MKCTQCNGFGFIDNLEGDGLICPKCNGTGEYKPFDTDVELDKLYPTIQTNEEWFCQLPTEEKAEWLIEFAIRFIPCELTVLSEKIKTYKNNILEWLKEAHESEEK